MKKKAFVLGMARSGYEAAKLLAKDYDVLVTDMKEQDEEKVKELESMGVSVCITDDPLSLFDSSYDLVVKNPGIKYTHPVVVEAKKQQISVINELELAFLHFPLDVTVIGITGSNGKTTTTTLVYEMLKEDGKSVLLGGNIGVPVCHLLKEMKQSNYVVLEVSDHQLCDVKDFKTHISVLTNLFPIHLDFHDSYDRYKEMKKRIFAHHTSNDLAIINKENEDSLLLTRDLVSKKEYFSSKTNQALCYLKDEAIYYKEEKILDTQEILLKGVHNYENIMAAILAAKACDVKTSSIQNVLKSFKGVEHRLEFVRDYQGVSYYNDSKATNCESTKIALNSFDRPTILILGGLDRGHSFADLKIAMSHVIYVACYGETKTRIKEFCDSISVPCQMFETLREATSSAKNKAKKGDVVLLSPACASWDQYDSFEKRGEEFKKIVLELGEK